MASNVSSKGNSLYEYSSSSSSITEQMTPSEAAWAYLREYARERPEVVVLWSFGIGFLLGWKLKPW